MNIRTLVDSIRSDGAVIAGTHRDQLSLAVPSCPDWTVRDLIIHVGVVHRWAARFLAQGSDPAERFGFDTSDVPDDAGLTEWYAARVAELLERLEVTSPDTTVRSFAGQVSASFWFRRQAHETSMHRWDLQNATPQGAEPVDGGLAADGINEWLEVFVPRFLKRGPGLPDQEFGRVIRLVDPDVGEWTMRLEPDAVKIDAGAHPEVVVSGSMSDLLLALWRRIPLSQLSIEGNRAPLDALLDAVRVT
ncbi:maleylpyruvate isomerase family mycothiol-dependent enzyme [Gordonia effusa]|uniref:maleylpyruvate isomerase family mycothiol-dependent enzyme n=1 Tax=Gordonia effusa TaxID=263908 RepID=UPI0002DA2A93|nr:maleylpyruvate isomerase family mycothiol-dependent enzyme [Gordonia effusa]